MPSFKNYTKFADPEKKVCNFGGIACYVKNSIANHVFQMKYYASHISFRIDTCPKFMFIGVYIQPEGGRYFDERMFTDLATTIMDCHEAGLVPYIGGDFNCRPGNFDAFSNWKYSPNTDATINKHGRTYFTDLCRACNVKPINGLVYKKQKFDNDFTFVRGKSQSQIDFSLTDDVGRKFISSFDILQRDWHLSDHKPISLVVELPADVDLPGLLRRACDLNYVPNDMSNEIKQFKGKYDYDKIRVDLVDRKEHVTASVNNVLQNGNIDAAIELLDETLKDVHGANKIKHTRRPTEKLKTMDDANAAFDEYMRALSDPSVSADVLNGKLETYKSSRRSLTANVLRNEAKKWDDVMKENDTKRFWSYVDWKGNFSKKKELTTPSMKEFEVFFEDLYQCQNQSELYDILSLETDVHVPILDDPINETEVNVAFKDMKKSGFDYGLPVLAALVGSFPLLLVTIFNVMFFLKYPMSLACSLLSLIPKKGNLSLPKNFRGIQMLKALACLYDRVIGNRLKKWLPFNIDQTAFQKFKSTLLHIFTLRVLIELVKKKKLTLYVGSMDIEKAFDHVSRYLMLKRLVKLGIGKCMLFALKQMYSYTVCVLKFQNDLSQSFVMSRGVRQGAATSVLLFNAFIDGLFEHLEQQCSAEELLCTIHALIHADDTIIISTNREMFIKKWEAAVQFFNDSKLNLNIGKSGYLIINASKDIHEKTNIVLNSGVLKYCSSLEYLGVIISDSGSIKSDVKSFIDLKRSNISIKFGNFCRVNRNAPLSAKLTVLDTCVSSSITYAAETWGNNYKAADICFSSGLRTALSVRQNTNNEIVYVESGTYPLHCRVQKSQVKFWAYVLEYMEEHPDAAISKIVKTAIDCNVAYTKYYVNLAAKFNDDPARCFDELSKECSESWSRKFEAAAADRDSKLATYHRVNPLLQKFVLPVTNLTENERILLTRFRTGSHSLAIETGRFSNTPRENRLCLCGSVQTVLHIFTDCPLTRDLLVDKPYVNLQSIFDDPHVHSLIVSIAKPLKLSLG